MGQSRNLRRGHQRKVNARIKSSYWAVALCGAMLAVSVGLRAETCTTQSQMQPADRDSLATAAREIAGKIQAGDMSGLQSLTVPEFASNFDSMRTTAQETATHLKMDALALQEIFLLDAAGLAAGSDAQFFCTLNHSQSEVDFSIRGLSSGMYGFAVVNAAGVSPWRVSLLLRRDAGRWLLAGFFPAATTAAGHDGLWFWREARRLATAKQPWNAWLYYGEAQTLLQPAGFVQTTHLERLQDEQKAAAPPQLSSGIGPSTPLVVKGVDGREYRFVGLAVSGATARDKVDVFVHVEGVAADPAGLRAQSDGSAKALVAAYPELRSAFGGVLVSLEISGQNPLITETPIIGQ